MSEMNRYLWNQNCNKKFKMKITVFFRNSVFNYFIQNIRSFITYAVGIKLWKRSNFWVTKIKFLFFSACFGLIGHFLHINYILEVFRLEFVRNFAAGLTRLGLRKNFFLKMTSISRKRLDQNLLIKPGLIGA